MSKICGYSCEHNKSGVCQISVCDKRPIMSDKTEIKHLSQSYYDLHEKYYKLQQENQSLKERINKLQEELNEENLECSKYAIEFNDLKEKNKQLKDNWNKLKEYIYNQIPTDKTVLTKHIKIFEVLDKMQEIEGSDNK